MRIFTTLQRLAETGAGNVKKPGFTAKRAGFQAARWQLQVVSTFSVPFEDDADQ